jgi:hypothetical protein
MSARLYRTLERISIAMITLGIVGMFQSVLIDLYTWGFHFLLAGTLAFIILTHIPVRVDDVVDSDDG